MTSSGPARTGTRPARSTIPTAVVAVLAAVVGALGYQSVDAVTSWVTGVTDERPAAAPGADQGKGVGRPLDAPPRTGDRRSDRTGRTLGTADGAVPDGVSVFDDGLPAVANLDPALLGAVRRAATAAARDGVEFTVNSGWRSPQYQDQLLREAVAEYGSQAEAARWVATADTSPHVSGDAIDVGPVEATAWLSEHGADYGLCRIYRNEPWHYELRPAAADRGCPRSYADPTHDPRMQK